MAQRKKMARMEGEKDSSSGYKKLNMAEMGITLTGNCFLLPEKSVTAFAFIHNLQENQQ